MAFGALLLALRFVASAENNPSVVPNELREHVHPDVRYVRKELSESENAFAFWLKAIEEFKKNEQSNRREDIQSNKEFSLHDAELWVQENESVLALLDAGVERGKCQFPHPDHGYHTLVEYLSSLSAISDIKLLRAKVRMQKGRYEDAAEDLIGLLKLSDLVSQGNGVFVHLRCGWAFDRRTTMGITALTQHPDVGTAVLQRLLSATEFSHDLSEAFRDALRLEIECFLMSASEWPENLTNAIETEVVSGKLPKGMRTPQTSEGAKTNVFWINIGSKSFGYHKALLSGHPNALDKPSTVSLFSKYLAHLGQTAAQPILAQQTNVPYEKIAACRRELDQFWNSVPTIRSNRSHFIHLVGGDLIEAQRALAQIDNPVGNQIVLNTIAETIERPRPYLISVSEQIAAWRLERAAVKTLLALRLYWHRNGKLPSELADLVKSEILLNVPVDPFSGGPLRYSQEQKVIWSCARDKHANDQSLPSFGLKFTWNISLPSELKFR